MNTRAMIAFILVASCCLLTNSQARGASLEDVIRKEIRRIATIPDVQLSKILVSREHQFLSDTTQLHTNGQWLLDDVMEPSTPDFNNPVVKLVSLGPSAIRELCKHLDDMTPTKVKFLPPSGWTGSPLHRILRYDHNNWPANRPYHSWGTVPSLELPMLKQYVPTVGDVCYFVVGQITNRDFLPWSLDGPQWICGPSVNPVLGEMVRNEWANKDVNAIKASLVFDVMHPDSRLRGVGALRRIKKFYPKSLLPVLRRKLDSPIEGIDIPFKEEPDFNYSAYLDVQTLDDASELVCRITDIRADFVEKWAANTLQTLTKGELGSEPQKLGLQLVAYLLRSKKIPEDAIRRFCELPAIKADLYYGATAREALSRLKAKSPKRRAAGVIYS